MASIVSSTALRRVVYLALVCLLSLGAVHADSRPAPQFSANSMDGRTISNSSLRGNVVLLQFWTTWCPICRRDQPAVEAVQSAFAGDGLVVVAINDGESEAVVRQYLLKSPRSCSVIINGHDLAGRFGVHSYPHYVVIDRTGNIVASRAGGGGEEWLRYMLRSAGLGAKPEPQTQVAGAAPAPSVGARGPQWTNVTSVGPAITGKPLPKTIFVFTDGERLEADRYTLSSNFLRVTADGQDRSIPISSLDVKKTVALNHDRGINVKIPTGGNELFVAF